MPLKTKLRIRSKTFGNTYDVVDTKTGEMFTIDEFPKRDRTAGSARYIVSPKYRNEVVGKTKTLREAKKLILEKVS